MVDGSWLMGNREVNGESGRTEGHNQHRLTLPRLSPSAEVPTLQGYRSISNGAIGAPLPAFPAGSPTRRGPNMPTPRRLVASMYTCR